MMRDVARSNSWGDRLSFVLRGPGWATRHRPEGVVANADTQGRSDMQLSESDGAEPSRAALPPQGIADPKTPVDARVSSRSPHDDGLQPIPGRREFGP
jgi:hypothetical protein